MAFGFRAHSGWTAAVAVTGSPLKPVIIERRRIQTADLSISGSKQPYHSADELCLASAESWIEECRERSTQLAVEAMNAWTRQLQRDGWTVGCAGILTGTREGQADLEKVLRSHAMIHTAEGQFYREVMATASTQCSLRVTRIKEREVWQVTADAFRLPVATLEQRIGSLGKLLGPPWRQDEKLASLAAWMSLAAAG